MVESRRYHLSLVRGLWTVSHMRIWPVSEDLGGLVRHFNDEYWSKSDEDIKEFLKKGREDFRELLTLYLDAHRFAEAYAHALKTTGKQPRMAEAWKASAALAHELGDEKKSLINARKAITLDPSIDIPHILRSP